MAELGCFVAPCRHLFFILFPEHQSARKAPVDVAVIFPFKKAAESSNVASVEPRQVQLFLYIYIFALIEPVLMPDNMGFLFLPHPPHLIVTERANHARDHLKTEVQLDKYDG